jgi:hypothetical protein
MNRADPHRRRLFLKTLLAAAAPVPAKAFSGAGRMKEQEIFDAIHSLSLLREEKDIDFFIENRTQQIDKRERSEFNPSWHIVIFKPPWQPLYKFDYAVHANGRLAHALLYVQEIKFGEIRKEFSQIYFGFFDGLPLPYMVFVKKLPQGTLCFGVMGSDSLLTADDYGDIQNGILREEKLNNLPVDRVTMYYGKIFKGYQLEDDPSYEQG